MKTIINKILVANRGEIAVRIIKSIKQLGKVAVAIYSDADKNSLHARMADEAYCIGSNLLSDSYLNIEKLISLAKQIKVEAIHPGYGFLSENPQFVEACERENIIFIGPKSSVMRLMGNKIAARKFADSIGVPITKGLTGNKSELLEKAKQIPFPLLIKAAAGGGGKGMKIVKSETELEPALESASREALSYFGDETVYIEQFIENPRHIEIQVIGDNYGNIIHLYERECSLQRRYQKIIEESPSLTLTHEVRENIANAAVTICKTIGYTNAGTIEFLVDKNLKFYFLEMNTRVQVEHPVTEMVTTTDIVEQQILIAEGSELAWKQSDIQQHGHAIECRIYAENPEANFIPSPGDIIFYQQPSNEHVRVDTSTDCTTTIQSFFDPMIAKLIVWGESREMAREKMLTALQNFAIHGIKTNISFLTQLLIDNNYIENTISTTFCDNNLPQIVDNLAFRRKSISVEIPIIAYLLYDLFHDKLISTDLSIWKSISYWRQKNTDFSVNFDNKDYLISAEFKGNEIINFKLNNNYYLSRINKFGNNYIELFINEQYIKVFVSYFANRKSIIQYLDFDFTIFRNDILLQEPFFEMSEHNGHSVDNVVVSPMHGKVLKVNCTENDEIKKGKIMMVIEAMKMENNIVAQRDATVEKIYVKSGQMVETNSKLIDFKIFLLLIIFSIFTLNGYSQGGYSSGSYSVSKARAGEFDIPKSSEIVVEEYMNYHRHQLPTPKAGEAVSLDLRWGNSDFSPNLTDAVLQIGFATEQLDDYSEMPPLNIALVIDHSGSMDGEKIQKVKEALLAFVDKLRTSDLISIVLFDSEIQTLFSPQTLENKDNIKKAIESIEIGSSTNLHGGLMQGYAEVMKNKNDKFTNTVILLTDGVANQGITNHEIINNNSKEFNDKGISLSVIGVGTDLDFNLLKQLAQTGNGASHFVNDAKDIQKIFIDELESLLSPIAQNPVLEVEYDRNMEIDQIFGYSPSYDGNKIIFKLNNMNSGLTQIVLIRYKLKGKPNKNELPVSVRFSYFDIRKKVQITKNENIGISFSESSAKNTNTLIDKDVKKNYTIAIIAQTLKDMAKFCEQNDTTKAKQLVNQVSAMVSLAYPTCKDDDINRMTAMLEKYTKILNDRKIEGKKD